MERQKHRANTVVRQHYTFSKKFAQSLKPKFVYCGTLRKHAGWRDVEHRHKFCEILFIKSGSGEADIGGTRRRFHAGDLVVYNAGVPHGELSDTENPMEAIFFAASGLRLHGLSEEHLLPGHTSPVLPSGEEGEFFGELFSALLAENERKGLFYKEISENLVKIIIHLILRISVRSADLAEINETYYKVKTYLEEHFAEEITLDTVCGRFFISKSYLSHIFKELNGDPPMKYLGKLRLERARHLLSNSSLPVRQVAERSGFPDTCYFCRVFKAAEGVTPLAYRAKYGRGEGGNG